MEACRNCNVEFSGSYCPECGQKRNDGKLVFRKILRDFIDTYWDFDAPFFKTIRYLSTDPTQLIRNYIQGQRKSYSQPVRYFIAITAVYLIIKNLINYDVLNSLLEAQGISSDEAESAGFFSPEMENQIIKPVYFFVDHMNWFMIFFVFSFAGVTRFFFSKSGYHFTEYLVFSFYILAQYILYSIVVMVMVKLDARFIFLNPIILFCYSMWTLTRFHEGSETYRLVMSFYTVFISWGSYLIYGIMSSQGIIYLFGL